MFSAGFSIRKSTRNQFEKRCRIEQNRNSKAEAIHRDLGFRVVAQQG